MKKLFLAMASVAVWGYVPAAGQTVEERLAMI